MGINMNEYGKKERKNEKENIYILMMMNLMGYLNKINNMKEMDIYIMRMVIYIKVIQKEERRMEKEK